MHSTWGCMSINQHSVGPGAQVQRGLDEMLPKEKSPRALQRREMIPGMKLGYEFKRNRKGNLSV